VTGVTVTASRWFKAGAAARAVAAGAEPLTQPSVREAEVERTVLANGIRIVTERMPEARR